jgi:hypothetical protein
MDMLRVFGTARRRIAAGALAAVVVLAAVAAALLLRSGPSAPVRAEGTARTPGTSVRGNDFLYDVSCVSSRFCVTAGYYSSGGRAQALIESWDGTHWSIAPSPRAGADSQLQGVSCVSRMFCVATGSYHPRGGQAQALIESWDGARWSIAASPSTSDGSDFLASVSCTSSSFCAAVGRNQNVSTQQWQALIESWDGTRWSIAHSPSTPARDSDILTAVSCTSGSACTAVGDYLNRSESTLVESWDGTRWSIASTAGIPGDAFFSGVSCAGGNFCVAAGEDLSRGAAHAQPLIESWDGARWSMDATSRAGGAAVLLGVSCAGSSDCVATGWNRGASGSIRTLVESWDGSRWSTAASLSASMSGNEILFGVSCVPGFCASAGHSIGSGHTRTLVELRGSTRWSIAASPNK